MKKILKSALIGLVLMCWANQWCETLTEKGVQYENDVRQKTSSQ